jgi:putative DNA primase/helicase
MQTSGICRQDYQVGGELMLKPIFENIPSELTQRRQWVNWKLTPRKEGQKLTKPPLMPSGAPARTDDPATWSHFLTTQAAYKAAANQFDGVGFLLTKNDPYVGVDFDNCRCPAFDGIDEKISGALNMVFPEVAERIKKFNSYTEVLKKGKYLKPVKSETSLKFINLAAILS